MPALGTGAQALGIGDRVLCHDFPVEQPHVKLSGDFEGSYVVEEARADGRLLVAPDTSARAIMGRLGHEPATLAEFEAAYGAVKPSDGEG